MQNFITFFSASKNPLKCIYIVILWAAQHYEVVYLIHEDCKEEVENVNSKVQGNRGLAFSL